jgi:hypothetical protein
MREGIREGALAALGGRTVVRRVFPLSSSFRVATPTPEYAALGDNVVSSLHPGRLRDLSCEDYVD